MVALPSTVRRQIRVFFGTGLFPSRRTAHQQLIATLKTMSQQFLHGKSKLLKSSVFIRNKSQMLTELMMRTQQRLQLTSLLIRLILRTTIQRSVVIILLGRPTTVPIRFTKAVMMQRLPSIRASSTTISKRRVIMRASTRV